MMHNYRINCSALMQNNLFREVEIMSYVNGKSKLVKTRADIETFCLYDFLIFLSNAKNRRVIIQDGIQYAWINYPYLIEKNPTLFLNNVKIKRMLSILEKLELLSIVNESGSIYIAIKNLELVIMSNEHSVMNHNQGSVMNHNQGSVMNHNYNNNKESIIIKNQDNNTPEFNKLNSTPKEKNQNRFNEFWSLYPKKVSKQKSEQLYLKAIKEVTEEFLINTLKKQIQVWSANKTSIEFIPHCTTWLNQKRYCDDFDTLLKQSNNNQPVRYQTQFPNETRIRTGREIAEEIERERNQQQ